MEKDEEILNEFGNLKLHRTSFKGCVQDHIITFNQKVTDLDLIVAEAYNLIKQLFKKFEDKTVKARLIAKIKFSHKSGEDRSYHFASYQAEIVTDVHEFFVRHMLKIASRLDAFDADKVSNAKVESIEHLYIPISVIDNVAL